MFLLFVTIFDMHSWCKRVYCTVQEPWWLCIVIFTFQYLYVIFDPAGY